MTCEIQNPAFIVKFHPIIVLKKVIIVKASIRSEYFVDANGLGIGSNSKTTSRRKAQALNNVDAGKMRKEHGSKVMR
jgi:hypothetical protein